MIHHYLRLLEWHYRLRGGNDHPYYKRGNTWTTVSISKGPEQDDVAGELEGPLGKLIRLYEIKLEKVPDSGEATTKYKARPDGTTGDKITVEQVTQQPHGGYKGYKHILPAASSTKEINRVTIHGQIVDIEDLQDGKTIENKQYVYVYFKNDPNNQRPLLICLAESESASENNIWYKRKNNSGNFTWEKVIGNNFRDIRPGGSTGDTIGEELKRKLDEISQALGTGDPGYPPLGIIVKLDYAPKSTGATDTIKYRTGDKQVTVEGLTPNSGFKGYKHSVGEGNAIDKVKIHGHEITQISADDLQDKQYVFVYYSKDGDNELQKPYLICLSKSGRADTNPNNIWYKRTNSNPTTWTNANDDIGSNTDPNKISGFAAQLERIKSALDELPSTDKGYTPLDSVEIDISQTPGSGATNGGFYMSGNTTIQVEKKTVPNSTNWVYYKHSNSVSTSGFTLGKITHSDVPMTSLDGSLNASMSLTIQQNGAIYVYYKDGGITQPKVICISKATPSTTSNNKWYKAGQTATAWTNVITTFTGKDPTNLTDVDLNKAPAGNIEITQSSDYVIKLDKRPNTTDIKYRTKEKVITVEKKEGSDNKVPTGYVAYTHGGSVSGTVKFKHNGVELNGLPTSGVTIDSTKKLWVYYKEDDMTRPLLIYVNDGDHTWYHRGLKWELTTEVSGNPNGTSGNTISGQAENLFTGKLVRQGKFLELVCTDDMYPNSNYWNFYFIIQPYVLQHFPTTTLKFMGYTNINFIIIIFAIRK